MPFADPTRAISLVGALVQLGVTLLVAALAASLQRGLQRRHYLSLWAAAWAVLVAGLAAVALRHLMLLGAGGGADVAASQLQVALHAVYQGGKLGFLALLLLGCLSLSGRQISSRRTVAATVSAIGLGLLLGANDDLDRVLAWQALATVPVFGLATRLVATAGRGRRGVGMPILVGSLGGLTLLWIFYLPAFWATAGGMPDVLRQAAAYSSYIDSAFTFLLALGMVVTYVEDTHTEADAIRRRQIEELARSERQLAAVFGAAQDGILTLDAERRITAMNPAAARIFDTDDAAGLPFDRFVEDGYQAALWADPAPATRRSEAYVGLVARRELTGRRDDGSEFPLEVAISSLDDESRGYVVVARDLTERLQQRDERDQLQQQVTEAARLEAVGRMVSGVAHELNNPLMAIMAFSQDLLSSARSDQDREALTVVVQQAQRCRVIVGDLLILARNRREERRRVTPREIVDRVLRVFARDSARHGVALATDLGPDLPLLEVDPVGIEQVLTNLLTNAFQATAPGGQVTLRGRPTADWLELVVEDTGSGIPADLLLRVFEPFVTTKDPGMGTGLGLSVSHALIRQHRGTLDVENREDGPGARFTVRLPFVDRRSVPRSGAIASPAARGRPPEAATRRVLIVDDEEAIRVAVRRSLERRGWRVDLAVDGQEALLRLGSEGRPAEYDAIVTDLRMPGMSGIELCDTIATRHPRLADRVVVITGDTTSPAVAAFLASGDRPVLRKPFDMRALAELLDQMVVARGGTI